VVLGTPAQPGRRGGLSAYSRVVLTPGIPRDLDEESVRRIARSFYVMRMVRYTLLLVALVVFLVASLVTDAPTAVVVGIAVTVVALVGIVAATHRTYLRSQRPSPAGPSAPSPRG
jgi:archaellum biogenesis protein FlaJ (TadC family)